MTNQKLETESHQGRPIQFSIDENGRLGIEFDDYACTYRYMSEAKARELRDWLNRVLPDEPPVHPDLRPDAKPYCRLCGGDHWVGAHDTASPNRGEPTDEPECLRGGGVVTDAGMAVIRERAAEPTAPQWDINSIERIARQQGVFGGRDGNTVKITGPINISGPAMTRCGSCGQDYDMNAGHDCPEFHAK